MTDVVVPGGTRCGICGGDPARLAFVDERCREGYSSHAIEVMSKVPTLGPSYRVKKETVQRHRTNCLGQQPFIPVHKRSDEGTVQHNPENAFDSKHDLAEMVQREAVRRVLSGEVEVTVREGLAAQALLDRREERRQDRDLDIARMLSGAGFVPPATVIDGEFRRTLDVTVEERVPHPKPDIPAKIDSNKRIVSRQLVSAEPR